MKKKCFAALSGFILAISIIAPFSFNKVYAVTAVPQMWRMYSFEQIGSGNWLIIDFYFNSDMPINSTSTYIRVNDTFAVPGNTWAGSLIESDGVTTITSTDSTSGTAHKQTWTFTLNNCSYFHFQVKNVNTSYWTGDHLTGPGEYARPVMSVGSYNQNIDISTTSSTSANVLKILNAIQNLSLNPDITIDLSTTNDLLNDILVELETNSTDNQSIITELTNIKTLLQQNQGNTSSQNTVNNNDNANEQAEDVIDNYDTLTSTFESDFVDSQEEMNTIMENNSLSQFSSAMIWFTAQLGFLYESLGDMKILVILPLLLGIALFFIGRGNVIFRNPNTFTEQDILSESYYDKDSGFTSTKTYTKTHRTRIK